MDKYTGGLTDRFAVMWIEIRNCSEISRASVSSRFGVIYAIRVFTATLEVTKVGVRKRQKSKVDYTKNQKSVRMQCAS